jgi:hypothetical protein
VNGLADAVVTPGVEVVLHRAGWRKVVREQLPLAPAPALVEQCVDDLPHLVPALMAADRGMRGLPRDDHRLDQRLLLVAQVGLVGLALAHGAQPNMPLAADRPGYRTATRSGDAKTPTHSHTALSDSEEVLAFDMMCSWLRKDAPPVTRQYHARSVAMADEIGTPKSRRDACSLRETAPYGWSG